MSMRI